MSYFFKSFMDNMLKEPASGKVEPSQNIGQIIEEGVVGHIGKIFGEIGKEQSLQDLHATLHQVARQKENHEQSKTSTQSPYPINKETSERVMNHKISVPSIKHQRLKQLAVNTEKKEQKAIYEKNLTKAVEIVTSYRFWFITKQNAVMIYDSATGLLWDAKPDISSYYKLEEGKKIFKEINGLLFNKLPIYEEIKNITIVDFPLKSGKNARILDREYWLTNDKQTIDIDKNPLLWKCMLTVMYC